MGAYEYNLIEDLFDPNILFVNDDAPGDNSGISWKHAYTSSKQPSKLLLPVSRFGLQKASINQVKKPTGLQIHRTPLLFE